MKGATVVTLRRFRAWGLLAFPVMALAAVLLVNASDRGEPPAEAAGAAPDLAIAIDVDNNGTDDCDTRASTAAGTKCNVGVGNMFTVKGAIDKVAGLPGTGGYIVFQFTFGYTSPGLTRNNRVEPAREVGNPTYWEVTPGTPAVCAPNGESDGAGTYYVDCWQGTSSMYTGKLVEVDFTCASAGSRSVTMQDAGTYVHNEFHGNTPLDVDGDETLTINCGTPPTPTPTPTPKDPGGDTDGDGMLNSDDIDDDNDGCADVEEQGGNHLAGGLRNPHVFWDFFDTPDAAGNRDKAVSVSDISRVVARFGSSTMPAPTKQEAFAQALTVPPAAPAYHTGFDRTPATAGQGAWATNMPNASITVQDISAVVNSFGNSCAAAP
jgi:hypothetical protein